MWRIYLPVCCSSQRPAMSELTIEEKQLAILLHVRGFSKSFIAKKMNRSRSAIFVLLKQWLKGRFICNKKLRKRTTKLSAQQVYRVLDYFINNPFNTHVQCIQALKLPVARSTIHNVLKKNGIRGYVASSKQFISMQNQIERLRFAIKYQKWTTEWLKVQFIDEKTVQTYSNGKVIVKRKAHERFDPDKIVSQEVQNTKNKLNLVGVVSFNGPNVIYSVSTNFTGKQFTQLARDKLMDIVKDQTVLMDNATIHSNGIKYLKNSGVSVLDFPPKSNDMNLIENVWAMLQKNLNRRLSSCTISTKNKLLELVEKSWKEIPVSFFEKCVMSMPNRLKAVIEAKGRQTKY